MTQDNLLKSAIADANAIRETAIANAKEMMLESFKPTFDTLVSKGLRKEALEDTSKIGDTKVTVDNPGPKDSSKASWDSSDVGEDGLTGSEVLPLGKGKVVEADATASTADSNHGVPFGKGKRQEKVSLPEGEFPGEGELDIEVEPELGAPEDIHIDAGHVDLDSDEDDLDLESIIRELESDTEPNFEKSPDDGFGANNGGKGNYNVPPQIPVPNAKPDMAARDGYGSDEGGKGDEVMEDWDDPMAGKKVDGWKTDSKFRTESDHASTSRKTDGAGGKEVSPGDAVTEQSLEEILREMEADGSVVESEKIATENVELKRSLKEHRDVIRHLQSRINEVNMLNAKLLYTNKLFRSFELNGAQKMNIVETFDRCSTLREVKLVYATKAESLSGKFGKKSSKTISESLGSKPVGSTKPKSETAAVLAESFNEESRNRLRKLAGIKKQIL
jgi:hypothetical protein